MSRASVLAEIRQALGRATAPANDPCAARIARPPRHPRPGYTEAPLARFVARLESHAATVVRTAGFDEVPSIVLAFLERHGLPLDVALAPPLAGLPWPPGFEFNTARARRDESCAVSLAFAGIAETGSLMLLSGPDSPITHNFVPEYHLIVVREADVLPLAEDAWTRLRATGTMPRAVNLIAGPSRTGDVEQTIQLGAHGPREVQVILTAA